MLGGHPQIAGQRHEEAAADGVALDHGHRRLGHGRKPPEHARDASFVAESVLARLEGEELSDVRPRGEGRVARPAQHEHANLGILIELVAGVVQTFVHLEGHRVARGRPVQGLDRDAPVTLQQEIVADHARHAAPPV